MTPRVSVVVPSYNHEKFLPKALDSVLQQSYKDYEIYIIDDASSDHSVKVIKAFADNHPEVPVHWSVHKENQGGVITLNDLVECAQGEYVALINSDDLWMPDKLEQQVAYLDAHPEVGAVFTHALVVDDQGNEMSRTVGFPSGIFLQPNRSRGQWLRKMFYELNCLCHPSILIRKSVYNEIGLYDARFRQLPDFQMWIRVLKQTEIHIIEQPLVHLRIHTSNTSKISMETISRNLNEMTYILSEFFEGMSNEVLIDGFKESFKNPDAASDAELRCEKAFLFFTPTFVFKSLYSHEGLQQLYRLLKNPETRAILENQYQFDYDSFFALNGARFLDEYLLSPSFYFARPPEEIRAQILQISQESFLTLPYVLSIFKRYSAIKLRKFPILHAPLSKMYRWVRGMVR